LKEVLQRMTMITISLLFGCLRKWLKNSLN